MVKGFVKNHSGALLLILLICYTTFLPGCSDDDSWDPPVSRSVSMAIFSDPHYYDPDLGTVGEAFDNYIVHDRKLIAESEAIMDATVELMVDLDVEVVLVAAFSEFGEQAGGLGGFGELEAGGLFPALVEVFGDGELLVERDLAAVVEGEDGVAAAGDARGGAQAPAVEFRLDLGTPGIGGEGFDELDGGGGGCGHGGIVAKDG